MIKKYDDSGRFVPILYGMAVGTIFILGSVIQSLHSSHESPRRLGKTTRMLTRWLFGAFIFTVGFIPYVTPIITVSSVFFLTVFYVLFDGFASQKTGPERGTDFEKLEEENLNKKSNQN